MSAYGNVLGGKLRLKAPASAAPNAGAGAGAKIAGVKRPREETPPTAAVRASSGTSSSGVAASSSSSSSGGESSKGGIAVAAQPAMCLLGKGRLVTSGTTVHGVETKFTQELKVGDALQVKVGPALVEEVRIVKMVLSDTSAGINAPFSSDVMSASVFNVLKLPKAAVTEEEVAEAAAKRRREEEKAAFGEFASDEKGMVFTQRVKKEGSAFGGYKTVTTRLESGLSREELLDLRSKAGRDKYC